MVLLQTTPVSLERRFAGLDLVEGLGRDVVLEDLLGVFLDLVVDWTFLRSIFCFIFLFLFVTLPWPC